MRATASCSDVATNAFVVNNEPRRIALPHHEVREPGGNETRVTQLRDARRPAKPHRRARVHDNLHADVGGLAELLRIDPFRSQEQLRVDILEVVARSVVPVLADLGAVAVEGAAMQSRERAFYRDPRGEFEVVDRGKD